MGDSHTIMFGLQIYNSGASSIVKDWNLIAIGEDGQPVQGLFITDQGVGNTNVDKNGVHFPITTNNSIAIKTEKVPIQRNGMEDGIFLFLMPEISRDYLQTPGTVYELTFKDINNKTYTNKYIWPIPKR